MRPDTLEVLEKKVESKFHLTETGKDIESKTDSTGNKTNNWLTEPHETKKLLYDKEYIIGAKQQHTEWEKVFINYTSNGG